MSNYTNSTSHESNGNSVLQYKVSLTTLTLHVVTFLLH